MPVCWPHDVIDEVWAWSSVECAGNMRAHGTNDRRAWKTRLLQNSLEWNQITHTVHDVVINICNIQKKKSSNHIRGEFCSIPGRIITATVSRIIQEPLQENGYEDALSGPCGLYHSQAGGEVQRPNSAGRTKDARNDRWNAHTHTLQTAIWPSCRNGWYRSLPRKHRDGTM